MVEGNKFTGYDYKEVYTTPQKVSFLIDGYRNFGWELDQNMQENEVEVKHYYQKYNKHQPHVKNVKLNFKRDRKILNKMELTRLQRNFEVCVNDIEKLERSREFWPTMYSIGVGLVGVIFFIIAIVIFVSASVPSAVAILPGIPGVIGIGAAYFVYMKMEKKQTEKIAPFIEAKRDEIDEICEKGNRLL